MKQITSIAFLLTVLFSTAAHAVLPPFHQNAREIKAILSNEYLTSSEFTGECILDVKKMENGYLIETSQYYIFAEILYKPSEKIGPAEFDVFFHPPLSK